MATEQARGREIIVFTDYVCPFSYLSLAGLDGVAARGVRVQWRAFELRPAPLPVSGPFSDAEWAIVQDIAAEHGGNVVRPSARPRTRKAHEATRLAHTLELGDAMRHAIFDAYFRAGRDIGRIDVLVEIGTGIGLDPAGLKVALDVDMHTAEIEADATLAHEMGIEGTPAFVAGADVRMGYLSADHLQEWLED